jgi:hypothetical protein
MFDSEELPPGLKTIPPSAPLAALLASIDLENVSSHDRIVVLQALQRMASHFQAQLYAAIASVAEHMETTEFADEPELAWHAAATEIRAALRLTRRAAETELDLALQLKQRLPRVWNALLCGTIDQRRARVIADHTSHLDETTARSVVDEIITDAPGLTTGQLAARVRRLCVQADPETATERYAEAVDRRKVMLEAMPDGTATLTGLDLPPDRAVAAANHIDRLAKSINRQGDPRSIDQLRADVFLDLLAGDSTGGKGGVVEITADLHTLTELSETPGDLAGYGPVIADIARQVADAQRHGEWRFTITDPSTGLPTHDGTTRRRPTAPQRRTVEARSRTCIFPGCRAPAGHCDLDHRAPWAQQQRTSTRGLDPLCRYEHVTVRHRIGWIHQPLPGGDHLWISPLGHRYTASGKPP